MGLSVIDGYRGIYIDSSGDYEITTNIMTDGARPGIWLADGVQYVTLHLRSRIEGSGTNPGILALGGACITLLGEGGIIRNFHTAVELVDCYRTHVIGVDILEAQAEGIAVNGEDILIRDNNVRKTGGASEFCFGIRARGKDIVVTNNNVDGVACVDSHVYEACGICFDSCLGTGVIIGGLRKGRVSDELLDRS